MEYTVMAILFYSSQSFEVNESDVFTFNRSFKHKLFRIKINQLQMKETVRLCDSILCNYYLTVHVFRNLKILLPARECFRIDNIKYVHVFLSFLYNIFSLPPLPPFLLSLSLHMYMYVLIHFSLSLFFKVDAAIVRIMKMRRTLPHNLLISECLGQLRFDIRVCSFLACAQFNILSVLLNYKMHCTCTNVHLPY